MSGFKINRTAEPTNAWSYNNDVRDSAEARRVTMGPGAVVQGVYSRSNQVEPPEADTGPNSLGAIVARLQAERDQKRRAAREVAELRPPNFAIVKERRTAIRYQERRPTRAEVIRMYEIINSLDFEILVNWIYYNIDRSDLYELLDAKKPSSVLSVAKELAVVFCEDLDVMILEVIQGRKFYDVMIEKALDEMVTEFMRFAITDDRRLIAHSMIKCLDYLNHSNSLWIDFGA